MDIAKRNIISYLNDTQTDIKTLNYPRLKYSCTDTYLFFGQLTTDHIIKVNGITVKIDDEELTK